MKAYVEGKYRLVFSQATLDELLAVLQHPVIRARHEWSDDQIRQHFAFLLVNADFYRVVEMVSAALTRDVTDANFLALAKESQAEYLVTNDRRHLLPLGRFEQTGIVTPTQFLAQLG